MTVNSEEGLNIIMDRKGVRQKEASCMKIDTLPYGKAKCLLDKDFTVFTQQKKFCGGVEVRLLNQENTLPTDRHGGGSIMVWGCFAVSYTGYIIQSGLNLFIL
ncbi:hypothetical protein CHARACLAT_025739 [Characodon lateralis]|uniref:Uncharacterized protein n=1 Tax=Characodon lateralis TaxID=208331 RepID=A0ABU7EMA0_9TELE|nr:hypothetical protein [Characodon lateralis]